MSFPKQEENRIRVVLFGSWRLAFTLYSEFAETLFGVTLPTSSSNQSLFVFNQIINCKFAVQCNQFAFDSPFPPSLPHSPHFRWVLVGLLFSFFFFFWLESPAKAKLLMQTGWLFLFRRKYVSPYMCTFISWLLRFFHSTVTSMASHLNQIVIM